MSILYTMVPPIPGGANFIADGSDAQRRMGDWVAALAPDEFDLSCAKAGVK